ncbi:PREDICTED: probable galacturonosyltransferase 4 isoform X8 [Camelina sativa]|uniref:Hexosyltransferase n=1 Tax=Camelina sativa TaxID=90675 RepID=A0ABM0X600_CAMSA|nr:PREDICTED: probable galacturonosyltransferase 4 isoform X7 [Camelina sativa]XP_010481271.1 PREDICTED: probable galacturonosyltransferase 4 isoform X8 [Camelina sativa]
MMVKLRNLVLFFMLLTVVAPILLYTDPAASFKTPFSAKRDFLEDVTALTFNSDENRLNLLPRESPAVLRGGGGEEVVVYSVDKNSRRQEARDQLSARVLSATDDDDDNSIKQVADSASEIHSRERTPVQLSQQTSEKVDDHHDEPNAFGAKKEKGNNVLLPDAQVRHLKDQLIRAKVYLSLPSAKANPHFVRELRLRVKEVQRALADASKDSDLPKTAIDKLKAMEQTLAKGKQIQDDCSTVVKKLRAMLHSAEEQLRVHKKQTMFLTQLTAKTIPKGLHCLPLRLTTDYYALNSSQQQFPNQDKLEDTQLYHYALFSDNVLATSVVVNSTITNAKHPSKHVFHIVTDRLNYAAMRMWFLDNPPGKATIQVQNVEEFTWLNSSYSPVLKQLSSRSMIDYYFRAHHTNSDTNIKFRNPKYLSILNHLRFYLPEIFPKLSKVLFLDDDIVVQKDLSGLWLVDLKGNVNGAVETCGESFHRFDRYLNFSNPLISKNFDPRACGWAYGMNVFDLDEWKRQNITEVYHRWQDLNQDRELWKLGTLPPGLITFWRRTYPLDRKWHTLGLGYNPSVNQRDIERAAVIHYNGNLKPWLEIGIPRYRGFWSKHVDYEHVYLRECNINP